MSASPLGFGMLATYCTAVLPFPNGSQPPVMRAVTGAQPTLGIGADPRTNAPLPSVSQGRQLLAGALLCRLSTTRGSLPDTKRPRTTGAYGIDILDMVGGDMNASDVGMFSANIDAQCKLDQRVVNSFTSGSLVGGFLMLPIQITDSAGPFSLTLAIDKLTGNLSVLSTPGGT